MLYGAAAPVMTCGPSPPLHKPDPLQNNRFIFPAIALD
jgi:hypothetical protein